MGAVLALTAANSTPGECLLWHATASFTTPPFLLCHLTSEFLIVHHGGRHGDGHITRKAGYSLGGVPPGARRGAGSDVV